MNNELLQQIIRTYTDRQHIAQSMQAHRLYETFAQNEGVTPWEGDENYHLHALKTQKRRQPSLQPSERKLRSLSPKLQPRDFGLTNKILSRRGPLAKIDKTILAKTQDIHFSLLDNQTKKMQRQALRLNRDNSAPRFFRSNSSLKPGQCSKRKLDKLYQKKVRSRSNQMNQSKYCSDFNRIKSIKSKQLILTTNKNFFHPIQCRKNDKFNDRVSEMLSIIRRVMHKQGAIGKMIKKRQKSRLVTQKQRINIINS